MQKSSKFGENSKINNYSLVPQIEHPVALCYVGINLGTFEFIKIEYKGPGSSDPTLEGYDLFYSANQKISLKYPSYQLTGVYGITFSSVFKTKNVTTCQ